MANNKFNAHKITYGITYVTHDGENYTYMTGDYTYVYNQLNVQGNTWLHGNIISNDAATAINNSTAFGNNTKAQGLYSLAEGQHTTVLNESEHASGQYNVSKSLENHTDFGPYDESTLFTIGNGVAGSQHNALEIRQTGTTYISGSTYIAGKLYPNSDIDMTTNITQTHKNFGDTNFVRVTYFTEMSGNHKSTKDHNVTLYTYDLPTKKYVDQLLEAKDALQYRGIFTPANQNSDTTNEDVTTYNTTVSGIWTLFNDNKDAALNDETGYYPTDTTVFTAGSVYKVAHDGWFGNSYLHAGDMLISYSDYAKSDNIAGWSIVETHISNLSSDGKDKMNTVTINSNANTNHIIAQRVLTNVNFEANGTISYTYNDIVFINNKATGVYSDTNLKQYTTDDGLNFDISNNSHQGILNTTQFISNISTYNDAEGTHLSYTYARMPQTYTTYSTTNVNDIEETKPRNLLGINSRYNFITGVSIDATGHLTYTYLTAYSGLQEYGYIRNRGVDPHAITYVDITEDGKFTYHYVDMFNNTGTTSYKNVSTNKPTIVLTGTNTYSFVTGIQQNHDGSVTYTYANVNTIHGTDAVDKRAFNKRLEGEFVITYTYLNNVGVLTYTAQTLTYNTGANVGSSTITNDNKLNVVTTISQAPNGAITYGVVTLNTTHTYTGEIKIRGNGSHAITNVNIDNNGKLTYTYADLSTSDIDSKFNKNTHLTNETSLNIITGIKQAADGSITYTYDTVSATITEERYENVINKYVGAFPKQVVTNIAIDSTTGKLTYSVADSIGIRDYERGEYKGVILNDYTFNNAIGTNSLAQGFTTRAEGTGSHAEGFFGIAEGNYSHAEGVSSLTRGKGSHAEGYSNEARAQYSHAEGLNTTVSGKAAHTEGHQTEAFGSYSHAEGDSTTTLSTAIGSHAEGYQATTYGVYSHAEGKGTISYGEYSHAEGKGMFRNCKITSAAPKATTVTLSGSELTEELLEESTLTYTCSFEYINQYQWKYNYIEYYDANLINSAKLIISSPDYVKNSRPDLETLATKKTTDVKETHVYIAAVRIPGNTGVDDNGNDLNNFALTDAQAVAYINANNSTQTAYSKYTTNTTTYTFYQTVKLNKSYGRAAKITEATKSGSNFNVTLSNYVNFMFAMNNDDCNVKGYNSIGDYSHAEGVETKSTGVSSHAEGDKSISKGDTSHAEGYSTQAAGKTSHSEGWMTDALGDYSHAEGYHTVTTNPYEHASGKYNLSTKNTLFSIGVGTGENDRKNAFVTYTNGNTYITGHTYIGSNLTIDGDITNLDNKPVNNYHANNILYIDDVNINKTGILTYSVNSFWGCNLAK